MNPVQARDRWFAARLETVAEALRKARQLVVGETENVTQYTNDFIAGVRIVMIANRAVSHAYAGFSPSRRFPSGLSTGRPTSINASRSGGSHALRGHKMATSFHVCARKFFNPIAANQPASSLASRYRSLRFIKIRVDIAAEIETNHLARQNIGTRIHFYELNLSLLIVQDFAERSRSRNRAVQYPAET